MMRILFVQLIPGIGILALQNVLAARVHSTLLFCDVLIVFLALQIFFSKNNQWLFVSMFIIGFVAGMWSGRALGFDALLYGTLAFALYDIKKIILMHFLTFLTFVVSLFIVKFLFYLVVGFILHQAALYSFALTISFFLMMLVSMIISLISYIMMHLIQRYVK